MRPAELQKHFPLSSPPPPDRITYRGLLASPLLRNALDRRIVATSTRFGLAGLLRVCGRCDEVRHHLHLQIRLMDAWHVDTLEDRQ